MVNFIFKNCNWVYLIIFISMLSSSCNQQSYTDTSLPSEKRTELLLEKMTIDEKIGQLCIYVGELSTSSNENEDEKMKYEVGIGERAELIKAGKIGSFLKVPTWKETNILQQLAEQSRLKIPLIIATDAIHGHGLYRGETTVYATPISLASSFDPEMIKNVAKYTAVEMRATGYHWTFSPNIEVTRDARWGRNGETFGEDPYLITTMGKAMLKGYQGKDFSEPDNVIACAKHFIAGGVSENGLNGAPADISERTLREMFFPPFQELIDEGVYSIMTAHNEINGIPCHAHGEYVTGLIKKDWGFNGIVVSDWMDIERLASVHKIAKDEKEADKIAFLAGVDMHMQGPGFFDNIKALVENGQIPMERLNDAVRKILYAKFQMGLFENRYVDSTKVKTELRKTEHLELALETAQKSIVLLENRNTILPLNINLKSVFITGPNANSQAVLGDWSRVQPDKYITTVLDGIKNVVSSNTKVDYLECNRVDSINTKLLYEAKKRAEKSDVAIVVVGDNSLRFESGRTAGENLDRATLELAGEQLLLVKAIKESGTPVIVVLINGSPIASQWTVDNADALIEAWEPGMYGGQAVAEVIFGLYNPSGKMPITIPRSAGHIRSYYNHKPSAFHRGKFYEFEESPMYEFGYGLSYSDFEYNNLVVPEKAGLADDIPVSVLVKNTGDRPGEEVVLLYINDKISSVTTPVKKLVGFKRVSFDAGESKNIKFTISNKQFMLLDKNMNEEVEPGEFEIIVGNKRLSATVLLR
jgi:beta-glucosidase